MPLTPEAEFVLRGGGTEAPFTNKYWKHFEGGEYHCAGCGAVLFTSTSKFETSCGWPAFDSPAADGAVYYREDLTHNMKRVEVLCANCHGHLGHVFEDGPNGSNRYCINSCCLDFEKKV